MIKFTPDLSDSEVQDLVVRQAVGRKAARNIRLFVQTEMALPVLFLGYIWLCSGNFSFLYLLVISILCLTLALSYKKRQIRETKESIRALESKENLKPEYMVKEDGVHSHKEHAETFMRWSHFIRWGTQNEILYFETNDHKLIVCSQKQLSAEDFALLKALASEHIGAQNKEGLQ